MTTLGSVLVIGGCGGLGHHIIKQLVEDGEASRVFAFDINVNRNRVPGASYVQGSITSPSDLLRALETTKPRVVIHTASPLTLEQRNSRKIYHDVNIRGTYNIIDSIHQSRIPKVLIYTSSSSVVHNSISDVILGTEELPLCFEPEQTEYYTHTKAVAEDMVRKANRQNGLLTAVLRGTTLFGEGDPTVIPPILQNTEGIRGKFQVGANKNLFDFTYLGNAAEAHILAAKALARVDPSIPLTPEQEASRVDGETFVITNDEPWPFWSFVHAACADAGRPIKQEEIWVIPTPIYFFVAVTMEWLVWIFSLGYRTSRINRKMVRYFSMTRTFDISKAKARLGYKPKVTMEEGIKRAVDAYMQGASSTEKKLQ